jgi:branched-chain amino acid transport system permease protein
MSAHWRRKLGLLLLVAAALIPVVLGEHFLVFFLTTFFIAVMLTLGLQLIIGYAGVTSLGHAAFYGIGAYTSAILSTRFGVPFLISLPMGGLLAMLGGLVMSPIIRLREIYFAMASLAFGIVVSEVFTQWKPVTGGHDGLSLIPSAQIGPVVFDTPSRFYYLALGLAATQYLFFRRLLDSPFGEALNAMRQNEAGARAAGLPLARLKVWAILLGAVTAGLAGSLHASFNGSVSPQNFLWTQSIALLTMVVVGGIQSLPGVVASTFLLLFLSEYLRSLVEYKVLINGVILALFMIFLPRGLSGIAGALHRRQGSGHTPLAAAARVGPESTSASGKA